MAIGLNEDLTTEILLRSPVKSLLKFKIVSKQWLSIISGRRFRQAHASHHGSNLPATGLFFRESYQYKYLPLDEEEQQVRLEYSTTTTTRITDFFSYLGCIDCVIISSCNGLLLLGSDPFLFLHSIIDDRDYYICNPTTKEIKSLVIPQQVRHLKYARECLAFDPSESPYYKIVFLWEYFNVESKIQIMIYSSETGACRSVVAESNFPINYFAGVRGIFCNGVVHWVTDLPSTERSFYFDIERELTKEVPLPAPPTGSQRLGLNRYFGETRGRLRLARVDLGVDMLEIYELKGDNTGWFHQYQVNLACIELKGDYRYSLLSILAADDHDHEKQDEYLRVILNVYGDQFVIINLGKNKTVKKVSNVRVSSHADNSYEYRLVSWPSCHQLIETLASVAPDQSRR